MKRMIGVIGVVTILCRGLPAMSADFNGDGYDDIAIFRPSDGLWAIRDQGRYYFGQDGDIPVPGKFVSTSRDDIAVFRPTAGLWAIRDHDRYYFGQAGDVPIGACSGGGGASLWNQNGNDIYYTAGRVGIGTAAPQYGLQLHKNSSSYSYASFTNESTGSGHLDGVLIGLDASEDFRVHSYEDNNIKFFINNGEKMRIQSDGKVGIGTDSPISALHVVTNEAYDYAARFFNDGNSSNRHGIRIRSGSDTGVGTNYLVWFADGNDTHVGDITFTGGAVSYNNFTAEHTARLPEKDNRQGYPYGTVVSLRASISDPDRPRQPAYKVRPSEKPYDTTVFGVYAGKRENEDNLHSIYAIGDGHILVTREGGDIRAGDYLTTSGVKGHAMLQDDDLRHSYTVAKALEPVDWKKEGGDSKLISCTYQTQ